jgi:hypothetical protein
VRLRQVLGEQFTLDELQILSLAMGASWENLHGETLDIKAAALVEWAENRDLLYDLTRTVIRQRPDIDWREK